MNIGDVLYRYILLGGIHEFKVVGTLLCENVPQYIVEDQMCAHGWKCKLLVAQDSKGKYRYVSMLNDRDDDSQEYWHTDHNFFHTSLDACKEEVMRSNIKIVKENLVKAEERVKECKDQLKKYEDLLAVVRKQPSGSASTASTT